MPQDFVFAPELQAFAGGFPAVLLQAAISVGLLVAGAAIYCLLTPYRDVQEIRDGNSAAAISLGGALISLGIPLAASLGASTSAAEVLIWGAAVMLIQLLVSRITDIFLTGLPQRIREGEIPAAILLVSAKLAVAIILASAVAG